MDNWLSNSPRAIYIGLLAFSLLLIAFATHDEISGSVTIYSRRSLPRTYTREESPKDFHDAMTYIWLRALLPGVGGYLLVSMIRRQESLDPFSPTFKGQAAIDELGAELDRRIAQKKEAEKNAVKSANPSPGSTPS